MILENDRARGTENHTLEEINRKNGSRGLDKWTGITAIGLDIFTLFTRGWRYWLQIQAYDGNFFCEPQGMVGFLTAHYSECSFRVDESVAIVFLSYFVFGVLVVRD